MVGGEPMLHKLAATSLELLRVGWAPRDSCLHMPQFEDLYPRDSSHAEFKYYPAVKYDLHAPALILHSSGKHVAYPIEVLTIDFGVKDLPRFQANSMDPHAYRHSMHHSVYVILSSMALNL